MGDQLGRAKKWFFICWPASFVWMIVLDTLFGPLGKVGMVWWCLILGAATPLFWYGLPRLFSLIPRLIPRFKLNGGLVESILGYAVKVGLLVAVVALLGSLVDLTLNDGHTFAKMFPWFTFRPR
jgi:hypothetical protein